MRCIICDDWSADSIECDYCDDTVCDVCVVDGDSGETFCSEDCQSEYNVN
jgi:hypothetical protein